MEDIGLVVEIKSRVMPLLVDPIQTDLVYVQESEGVLSVGEGRSVSLPL